MIFVTVGGASFDELIKKIDLLKQNGQIKDKVIMQIGNSKYTPKHCAWFRFEFPLTKYNKSARLIISHEGAATLFELVKLRKRVIVLTNPNTVNNSDLVNKFCRKHYVLWCKNPKKLLKYITLIRYFMLQRYKTQHCKICTEIKRFLDRS